MMPEQMNQSDNKHEGREYRLDRQTCFCEHVKALLSFRRQVAEKRIVKDDLPKIIAHPADHTGDQGVEHGLARPPVTFIF